MLSENGVFGVVLSNNVATAERCTRERSRQINEHLKKRNNLSEAVGIAYKNRYYLAVDGVCYVADARYKTYSEGNLDNTYNYEWWFWDNIPARVWAEIDGALYFGTEDGMVCVFDDKYTDRTYQITASGELTLSEEYNHITYSSDRSISEGDRISFLADLYALVLEKAERTNHVGNFLYNKIKTSEKEILSFHEDMKVYADKISIFEDINGLTVGTAYYVCNIDWDECTFSLKDAPGETGKIMKFKSDEFRLYRSISETGLWITNVTANETSNFFQLKLDKDSEDVLTLVSYNETTSSDLIAKIYFFKNVKAEFYTPVFDLGTNESSKTLLKMTISTEPEINGKVSFGYETRRVNKLITAKGINTFSLDNLSFENFSFETGFVNSYSVKCNERNFNFIIFWFVSDNDSDCAVNSFTAVYKVNKSNKGVW